MFAVLMKHGGDRLTYWEGELRFIDGHNRKSNDSNLEEKKTKTNRWVLYMVCLRLRLGMLQKHLADMFLYQSWLGQEFWIPG